jgi:hypothetical protein
MMYPHEPAIDMLFRGALSNEMHMYALLSATASRMKFVSGVSFEGHCAPELFMQKALRSLRLYLESYTSPAIERQVFLDVFFLCTCEWYSQNYPMALMHLKRDAPLDHGGSS